jgi:3-oxoacyl-[acyl-carrier protein] reductase
MLNLDLSGKTALVTGASRGIGASIARRLAEHGSTVILAARSEEDLHGVAASIRNDGGRAQVLPLDLRDSESIQGCANAALALGPIHILVNNAGIVSDGLVGRFTLDEFDQVHGVNLRGPMLLSKLLYMNFVEIRWGRIISMGSFAACSGNKGQAVYASSKAGLEAFSRCLAMELASRHITVNTICAGPIATDMTSEIPENERKAYIDKIPTKSIGNPSDISALACFLASDEAAYITGQSIHVNGGIYLH